MKIEKDKLFSIEIKNRKQQEQGVLIEDGEEWILIRSLFSDYMIDGYVLLNKRYIKSINRDADDIFVEKVLRANDRLDILQGLDIPLSTNILIEYLYKNQTVFQIDNKEENKCWIGKICGLTEKSIFLTILTPRGIWKNSYYTFRKNNIRIISFDTDYINSLLNYNKTL